MNHIIINKTQAEEIRGNYGLYSAIEPIFLPDGNYIVPYACLLDKDLVGAKSTLQGFVKIDNTQEIVDLPKNGEQCIINHIYIYSEGELSGYSGFVICRQTHNRTIYKPQETPDLFSFFRENSDKLEWIPNEKVELGWKRTFGGKTYECLQPHQTQSDYTPTATLGVLWKEIPSETIPVWKQPTGAHDAYALGAKVHFPTITDPVYESLIDANVWSPVTHPSGWKKL